MKTKIEFNNFPFHFKQNFLKSGTLSVMGKKIGFYLEKNIKHQCNLRNAINAIKEVTLKVQRLRSSLAFTKENLRLSYPLCEKEE